MYLPLWLDEEYPELFWNRIHWLLGFVLQYVAAIIIKANIHVKRSYPHLRHETVLNSSEFVSSNVRRDQKNNAPTKVCSLSAAIRDLSIRRRGPLPRRLYLIWRVLILKIWKPRKGSFSAFLPDKFGRFFLLKDVKPCPDRKIIKLLTFDDLFPPLKH